MYILLQLFVIISEMACVPILYSLISGKEFNILTYISIILGNFIIGILLMSTPENFINYLIHPIYFIVISWILGKEGSTTLKIFYALFPITLINILHRLIGIFILPLFGVSVNILNASLLGNRLLSIFTSVIAFVFLKGNQYQFHSLADQSINYKDKRILVITNVSMVLYYIILQLLAYIEYTKFTTTLFVREALVIIYLVFFLIITNRLDLHLRERIQNDLMLSEEILTMELAGINNLTPHGYLDFDDDKMRQYLLSDKDPILGETLFAYGFPLEKNEIDFEISDDGSISQINRVNHEARLFGGRCIRDEIGFAIKKEDANSEFGMTVNGMSGGVVLRACGNSIEWVGIAMRANDDLIRFIPYYLVAKSIVKNISDREINVN